MADVRSRFTDDEMLGILRDAAALCGEPLTAAAYRVEREKGDHPWPTVRSVFLRFGSWHQACTLAGVAANPPKPQKRKQDLCSIEGCVEPHEAKGYCHTHYVNFLRTGDPLPTRGRPGTEGHLRKDGYREVTINGKKVLEHRAVMETKLRRPLLPGETVHHKNGVRDDNRPSNLVLRIEAHAKGLSVREAKAWAREILKRY